MKPGETDCTRSDQRGCSGSGVLVVKVKTTGVKELYYVRYIQQMIRRKKLGNWPDMTLSDARLL
ncbi:Arm DNA-binding domain-containing protein [Pseudomonas sp. OV226]|uniref:Arm DNA-binding domain-containing protein n=1 Tax=Pseudomonas sp. OV226 TaxID=2135588 RepID=UPI000D78D729|nr:hypothetical protein C7534_118114 [Pseudomonas sp. OV226]